MHPNVPDDVRWLVHDWLPNMEHVEVLLLLARREGGGLTEADILKAITIHADLLHGVLTRLVDAGLVTVVVDDVGLEPARYAFRPAGLKERGAVESLIRMYDMRPVSLIRFIYERPSDSARLFADAFRLRKPRE
jgi:hypothetical protein